MKQFIITLRHDKGKIKLKTAASSEDAAIQNVLNFEGCPRRAVINIKQQKVIS